MLRFLALTPPPSPNRSSDTTWTALLRRAFAPAESARLRHLSQPLSSLSSDPGATLEDAALVPRYPPCDPGFPTASIDAVLQSQSALLARLRSVVTADGDAFESHYLPVVRALVAWAHLLPASACEHFAAPGGLFRYALEMGVHCRQAAQACMFQPELGAQARHASAPRWRYASFLAGLLSPLPPALAALVVTGPDGSEWHPRELSLCDWLGETGATRYHAGWHVDHGLAAPPSLLRDLLVAMVPAHAMAWLREAGEAPVSELLRITSHPSDPAVGALGRLVDSIRARVLQLDELRRRHQGRLRCGHQLELHVVDAIRHRIESDRWAPSASQGPLWILGDALYLEWPAAAEAIRHDIARSGVRGMPLASATLADVLGRAGLLTASPSGGWLWRLPSGSATANEGLVHRTAVRLAEPRVFLGHDPAAPGIPGRTEAGSRTQGSAPASGRDAEQHRPEARVATSAAVVVTATAPDPAWAGDDTARQTRTGTASGGQAPWPPTGDRHAEVNRFITHCQQALCGEPDRMVCRLPDGRLGVAAAFVVKRGIDLQVLLAELERLEWLGRVSGGRGGAPLGMLAMPDGPVLGFVLHASLMPRLGPATA